MTRIILHCDLNCFYASVEMLYHPWLRNVPMAIAGDPENRHGIILTKNPLAKKAGVKTGESILEAKKKCPELIIRTPDYPSYIHFSNLVRELYYQYTDKVEPFGMDECWLDITSSIKLFGSREFIVKDIMRRVKEEIGLTLSIGVSFNKIYAKLGSDLASEDEYCVLDKPEDVFDLPVSSLLNVGRSTTQALKSYGLYSIGDIAKTSASYMKEILGKCGEMIYYFSWGYDFQEVKDYTQGYEVIKSIGNSTTTKRDLYDLDDIKIIFHVLADSVGSRLKDEGMYFRTVHIGVRNKKLECRTIQTTLKENSNLTSDIYNNALNLFIKNCDFKIPYRSVGISVSNLSYKKETSFISIFGGNYSLKQLDLENALEDIRRRFGYHSITSCRLFNDKNLSDFDPKTENTIGPVSYFRS